MGCDVWTMRLLMAAYARPTPIPKTPLATAVRHLEGRIRAGVKSRPARRGG